MPPQILPKKYPFFIRRQKIVKFRSMNCFIETWMMEDGFAVILMPILTSYHPKFSRKHFSVNQLRYLKIQMARIQSLLLKPLGMSLSVRPSSRPGFFHNSRTATRENCGKRELFYLVHLSSCAIFLSIFPANVAFRNPAIWFAFPDVILLVGISAPPVREEGTAAKSKDLDLSER